MHERDEKLAALQEALGYRFSDLSLLEEATTHSSCELAFSNERLEFLGDAVVGLLIGTMLYEAFPEDAEGVLTKKRSVMVRTESLARVANRLHLGECLQLGNGEDLAGGRMKRHILEDALEAVLGAVYLDGGFMAAKETGELLFRPVLENLSVPDAELLDFKSALQEKVQAIARAQIQYETTRTVGPPHKPVFTVELLVNGKRVGEGEGRSKKEAAQRAARLALAHFDAAVAPHLETNVSKS